MILNSCLDTIKLQTEYYKSLFKKIKLIYITMFIVVATPVLSSHYILIDMEIRADYTLYNISWKIGVDKYGYYYPIGGEWGILLPPNVDLKTLKVIDNFGPVDFKLEDNFLYFYNRIDIHWGNIYYFNISFVRKNNPISYDNEFYFESDYSLGKFADKIIVRLPTNVRNYTILNKGEMSIKVLNKDPYILELTSDKITYPKILFWFERFEEPKSLIEYKHFTVNVPSKYYRMIERILWIIDNRVWNRLENIFNYTKLKRLNITFSPYSAMEEDSLCLHYGANSTILCGINLLLNEEKYIVKTLIHELTHAFINEIFGSGLSPFFEEGLAEMLGYNLAEEVGYNFTESYNYRQKLIESCRDRLYEDFWKRWECERFGGPFCTFYFVLYTIGDKCFSNYTASEIRYTISWYIVDKEIFGKIGMDRLTYLSGYLQKNGVKINTDSANKNSIVVLMLYIVSGENFSKILKSYGIKVDSEWFHSYKAFKEAENKIQYLILSSDFDYYNGAKKILNESLLLLFNGWFEKSIEKSTESIIVAEKIKEEANKTKRLILEANQTVIGFKERTPFPCIYRQSDYLLLEAFENYKVGNFIDARLKIKEALDRANEINITLTRFLGKMSFLSNKINSSLLFIYKPFLGDLDKELEQTWRFLLECRLYCADASLSQIETKYKNSILFGNIVYLSIFVVVLAVAYFLLRNFYEKNNSF